MASCDKNEVFRTLQEFCQKSESPNPSYEFTRIFVKKNRRQVKFRVVGKIPGTIFQGEGTASTKAEAKRLAAEKMLIQWLEVKRSTSTALSDHPNNEVKMYLAQYCTQFEIEPKYEVRTVSIEKDGESVQLFEATCVVGGKLFSASAPDREEALRMAARNALCFLLAKKIELTEKEEAREDKAPECQAFRCKKFPVEIKNKALHIISQKYDSEENKALEILSALQLEYKTGEASYESPGQKIFFIEVKYGAGNMFISNSKDDLYLQLISYFKWLLDV